MIALPKPKLKAASQKEIGNHGLGSHLFNPALLSPKVVTCDTRIKSALHRFGHAMDGGSLGPFDIHFQVVDAM
jgi:hypothetical protein